LKTLTLFAFFELTEDGQSVLRLQNNTRAGQLKAAFEILGGHIDIYCL
jgi:hypothetical protein